MFIYLTPETLRPSPCTPVPRSGEQLGWGPNAAVSAFVALSSPGCTRSQRVVGRQPRMRTGQLTHAGHSVGSLLPTVRHRESRSWALAQTILGSRGAGEGHYRVTLRAWDNYRAFAYPGPSWKCRARGNQDLAKPGPPFIPSPAWPLLSSAPASLVMAKVILF